MLYCSIFKDRESIYFLFESRIRSLILISKLLSRGANPNIKVISRIIWEILLDYIAID